MPALFGFVAFLYLSIYAFEGVIRYALDNIGLSDAILLRDGLTILPSVLLLLKQAFRFRVHPAFVIFAGIVLLHGTLSAANLHTPLPAVYGAMPLINVLFGFIAARQLMRPGKRVLWILSLIWLASVVGVTLDKFVYTMPWTGLEARIGGITGDVSRRWDITGFDKPAAGFFQSSISAAMLVPMLALLLAARTRRWLIRVSVLGVTLGAVFLTTQKPPIIAIATVGLLMLAPWRMRYRLLCAACVGFAALDVALPLVTAGLVVTEGGGVFGFGSFGIHIMQTWPSAWKWIANNGIFPFGVGLGGIGGAQRFYAEGVYDPSDNLFVFLYANFGLLGAVYLAWAVYQGLRLPDKIRPAAIGALAILAFNLASGAALSMLDDQMSALFIGASVGMLWQLRQIAAGGRWRDPYAGGDVEAHAPSSFEQHVHAARHLVRLRCVAEPGEPGHSFALL
jgi:hypothetical protein